MLIKEISQTDVLYACCIERSIIKMHIVLKKMIGDFRPVSPVGMDLSRCLQPALDYS